MRVEAKKISLEPDLSKAITIYKPISANTITSIATSTSMNAFSPTQKIGILYSDKDEECAQKIFEQIQGSRIESPVEVLSYKYIIWIVSVDGIHDCIDVLDTAFLFPEKLLIFWWRAAALEYFLDVTMKSIREIHDSAFAFFPTNGTYIYSNAPTTFYSSLSQLAQWIKGGKNPQGQRIQSQKNY